MGLYSITVPSREYNTFRETITSVDLNSILIPLKLFSDEVVIKQLIFRCILLGYQRVVARW